MTLVNRPFSGIATFLRAPYCADPAKLDADIAVLGVPFDEGSPFMPGSRMAPRALREHSMRFVGGAGGLYDPETRRFLLADELTNGRIADMGDVDIRPAAVEVTFGLITEAVQQILARGALPVILGGDHAITFPVVRAFTEPLYVLHFDAHTDYAPFVHGLSYTNSHAFRHITAMSTLLGLTQIGIRSLRHTPAQVDDVEKAGGRIIGMNEFRRLGPAGVSAHVPDGARCYVSIDVDALDMSLVPGCVSAEPNGLLYAELRDALAAIASRLNVVGFDFVEVNPLLDVGTGVTSYLGAHTVIEFLGHICASPLRQSI